MERLNSIISSYQAKICKHDRQLWEQSYEKELCKRLNSVPRRAAKINTTLIDVDLFRGSAFSISKSQTGWLSVATLAWFRLVFFPFYYKWWLCSTCGSVFVLLCMLYVLQLGSLIVSYFEFRLGRNTETLTAADHITPYIMMYALTVIHCLITANYNIPVRLPSNGKRTKISHLHSSPTRISENLRKFGERPVIHLKDKYPNVFQKEGFSGSGGSNPQPGNDFSAKALDVEPEISHKSEVWLEPERAADSREKSTETAVEFRSSPLSKSDRESDQEIFDLNGASANDRTTGKDDSPNENLKSSGESLNTCLSQCSSINGGGSLRTVVGSSLEEMTITDSLNSSFGSQRQMSSIESNSPKKSVDSQKQFEGADVVSKSDTDENAELQFEIPTNFEGSHYLLSALDSELGDGCLEAISVADSNTSMSDTCNSSFISSNEEDDAERGPGTSSGSNEQNRRKHFTTEAVANVGFGVRHRPKDPTSLKGVSNSEYLPENGNARKSFLGSGLRHDVVFNKIQKYDTEEMNSSEDEGEHEGELGRKPTKTQMKRQSVTRKSCQHLQRKADASVTEETLLHKMSSADVAESQAFARRTRIKDASGIEKKSQSLPFVQNLKSMEHEDGKNKRTIPNRSAGQCSSERNSQSSKNSGGNPGDPAFSGLVSSSLINCMASAADKVSCVIWSSGGAVHKVDLTVLDIGWTIVRSVDAQQERCDYMLLGVFFSFVFMCTPSIFRYYQSPDHENQTTMCSLANATSTTVLSYPSLVFGHDFGEAVVLVNGMVQRFCLSLLFFFLLSVTERTFKQKLLYAKYFSYLTSSRKAKKYDLPHFRLNKVRNIKTWLSLRSFLKKRGPQRSVECVVSSSFILAVILVSILCIELLQDYGHFLEHLGNWELVLWSMILGVYLLRFITLGTKINKKYRNLSVLITEQINLYLHMEQKPHKKSALMVANSVLKLAEGLLKELESPFKISGLSANPFLYNITKVVILSAFSAVLTELLGFKLKLYKIKIRS